MGSGNGNFIRVGVFTVVMLMVAAGLVVVFGEFKFAAVTT